MLGHDGRGQASLIHHIAKVQMRSCMHICMPCRYRVVGKSTMKIKNQLLGGFAAVIGVFVLSMAVVGVYLNEAGGHRDRTSRKKHCLSWSWSMKWT